MDEDKKPINRIGFGILMPLIVSCIIIVIAIILIFLFYFVKNFISLFK